MIFKKRGGSGALKTKIRQFHNNVRAIDNEVSKLIIGQGEIINGLTRALMANGHVLLEGVPGLAKTLLIRVFGAVMGCSFKRIQFTPDLLPSDITGMISYSKEKGFYTVKGPIFANFILADEINRAPPKVQSALLEAMQEKQVTIGHNTLKIPIPFFVLATQNPLEQLGTYPLPEAQVDRFLFKLNVVYPNKKEELGIFEKNITIHRFDQFKIRPIFSPKKLIEMQELTKKIYLDKKIEKYIIDIVDATRNPEKYKVKLGNYVEWGASPRASIGLFIASKADALLEGKPYVTPNNVKKIAYDVLRHRILLTYEAQAEKITTDDIIANILAKVPLP